MYLRKKDMVLEQKVRLVEALFDRLEAESSAFQAQSGLHCLSGCGTCCSHPDINASPLEFLPWSYHLFLAGKAESTLAALKKRVSSICQFYAPKSLLDLGKGRCKDYEHRGLICRLFGYAARRDKYGKAELVTCKLIKEDHPQLYVTTKESINEGLSVPIFSDYYMNLSQIDVQLGNLLVPINRAMEMAIEEVLQYYAYRPFPSGFPAAA